MDKIEVKVGQIWEAADGSGSRVEVVDTETYRFCGDVVVKGLVSGMQYRIDEWKLTMVRYNLVST